MPLNELIQAGLFGRGLIRIDDPVLIRRYNSCLEDMGLPSTELTSFQIDRMGWSPEIASELGDSYYLSHGDANPLCIILTPEQRRAPIYFPMHSFDWLLMDRWFERNWDAVVDLTKATAIWLDIDQDVELYEQPNDLLMADTVSVLATTPCGLMERAAHQTELVARWYSTEAAHLDGDLIEKLAETAKEHGDLRRQSLQIPLFEFGGIRDFYSRAFGGTFVLRSHDGEPLVFSRDPELAPDTRRADETAIPILREQGYVESDISWWAGHLYRLKVVADSFFVEVLERHHPRIDYAKLNKAKRKGFIKQYREELGVYLELMHTLESLESGEVPEVSKDVMLHLLHPSDRLDQSSREVIWQLLTYIRGGRFVPLMYRHQKTRFVELYTSEWKKVRRSWALMNVQRYYDIASKSSGLQL